MKQAQFREPSWYPSVWQSWWPHDWAPTYEVALKVMARWDGYEVPQITAASTIEHLKDVFRTGSTRKRD